MEKNTSIDAKIIRDNVKGERKKMNLVQRFCPLATVNMQVWIQETMLVNDGRSILPQTAIRSKVSVDLCLVFG